MSSGGPRCLNRAHSTTVVARGYARRDAHSRLSLGGGHRVRRILLAVTVGFEPTVACTTHAFQACLFGHLSTSPCPDWNLAILPVPTWSPRLGRASTAAG